MELNESALEASLVYAKAQVKFGPLAQSVEQRTFNPWVVGSIPTGPTLANRHIWSGP